MTVGNGTGSRVLRAAPALVVFSLLLTLLLQRADRLPRLLEWTDAASASAADGLFVLVGVLVVFGIDSQLGGRVYRPDEYLVGALDRWVPLGLSHRVRSVVVACVTAVLIALAMFATSMITGRGVSLASTLIGAPLTRLGSGTLTIATGILTACAGVSALVCLVVFPVYLTGGEPMRARARIPLRYGLGLFLVSGGAIAAILGFK